MKNSAACAALVIALALAAQAQSDRYSDVTALLERYVSEQKIAGAVAAVVRAGKIEYLKAAGVQDLKTRAPMTERTLFRIYSMTKPVTAVAAMMLIEEGRASLSDPVSKYLPEFKQAAVALPDATTRPPTRAITVGDLLLHTSGLNHRTSELYRRLQVRSRAITLSTFIDNIVGAPLMEDPGTRFRYSEGTTVVGRLVEIWSGKSLDVFFDERIFKPLRMPDTTFWVRPEDRARLATVYGPASGTTGEPSAPASASGLKPMEVEEVPFTDRPTLLEGAVGLVSTVPDFLRFSQMLLNKGELDGARILKAATVDQMTGTGLSEAVQQVRGGSMGWGLANVNVQLDPTAPNRGEYGWDGTAGTIFWVDPTRRRIAILMTQSSPANPDQIRQRFKALIDRID
jgi:CubicO group peptidase (beta-lactamase class C family)